MWQLFVILIHNLSERSGVLMKSNSEIKEQAKQLLKGNWGNAVLLNLIPTLLLIGIILLVVPPLLTVFAFNSDSMTSLPDTMNQQTPSNQHTSIQFVGNLLGTFFSLAVSWTFLDMLRGKKQTIVPFKDAFRTFNATFALPIVILYVLTSVFQTLWLLLFVIPGLIKVYSYAQTYTIFYDTYQHTGEKMGYLASITASRKLMHGYKWKLFLLDLSFIGWHILALATAGIGYLWLTPYIRASRIVFYDNLPKELAAS